MITLQGTLDHIIHRHIEPIESFIIKFGKTADKSLDLRQHIGSGLFPFSSRRNYLIDICCIFEELVLQTDAVEP
jgi:hypothetical protein